MKISVLGCGRWGSFIAWYQATVLKNQVILYGEDGRESFERLKKDGKNDYIALDKSIKLTSDLAYAVGESDYIIISISSQALREFTLKVVKHPVADKSFILCMKGLEESTGKRLSQVVCECGISPDKVAVWVGPGHIQSFVAGVPSCMIIDSENPDLKRELAEKFSSNLIRFYYGDDLIGTEVGAAAKNVLGIAAGVLDGSGYATLKGALMARGSFEVAKLIKALGGNSVSAFGLAHLGDYETTLFSHYSHNRAYGEMLVQGKKFDKLAEGVMTSKAMTVLGEKLGIDLPITKAVYEVCFNMADFGAGGAKDCMAVVLQLFDREIKPQFYDINQ